jgi:GMP synthase-like glutamine amidotransferase
LINTRRFQFDAHIPVLGICYGQQTMCAQLGGSVEAGESREFFFTLPKD